MVSLLRLKDQQRYFFKAILNSFIFSFGIETTNIYIHALPYLENHTPFQTQNGQNVWHEIFAGVQFCGLAIFCVLRELMFAIRTGWFFLLGINFCDFQKVPSTQH